ncbi:hypothetical protein Micbo1qcDRAFT_173070 [Microdochium bolleyi]|uniref:Uncharacterized protein n=1 Tax=Microdochium bolleyi TaxID=196109 RepID=A0A136JAM0_9PEZI|nr:hypothetical protein Micbo1qcDRAFT_173070 [Microdochium bolleyi]
MACETYRRPCPGPLCCRRKLRTTGKLHEVARDQGVGTQDRANAEVSTPHWPSPVAPLVTTNLDPLQRLIPCPRLVLSTTSAAAGLVPDPGAALAMGDTGRGPTWFREERAVLLLRLAVSKGGTMHEDFHRLMREAGRGCGWRLRHGIIGVNVVRRRHQKTSLVLAIFGPQRCKYSGSLL